MINSIGQTIKRLRKERDLIQVKLAELLIVTKSKLFCKLTTAYIAVRDDRHA